MRPPRAECQNRARLMRKRTYIAYFIAGGLFLLAGIVDVVESGRWGRLLWGIGMALVWTVVGVGIRKKMENREP